MRKLADRRQKRRVKYPLKLLLSGDEQLQVGEGVVAVGEAEVSRGGLNRHAGDAGKERVVDLLFDPGRLEIIKLLRREPELRRVRHPVAIQRDRQLLSALSDLKNRQIRSYLGRFRQNAALRRFGLQRAKQTTSNRQAAARSARLEEHRSTRQRRGQQIGGSGSSSAVKLFGHGVLLVGTI